MRIHRFSAVSATVLAAALLAAPMVAIPAHQAAAQFGIGISVNVAPPPLPVYEQPPLPDPGYIWTPGYWAYGDYGYYWVPGTWVMPPEPGLLWTPGYWGWNNGAYIFNQGYWGPEVGYYGGIDYGFGYTGVGFEGGYWRDHHFFYNRAVNNFGGVRVANVYERPIVVRNVERASFNGPGGIVARPTPAQLAFAHAEHVRPTPMQTQHFQEAARNPDLRAAVNHGRPPIAATPRPAAFSGPGVVHGGAPGPHPVTAGAPGLHPGMPAPGPHPVPHAAPHMAPPMHASPYGGAPHPMPMPRPATMPHPAPMQPHSTPGMGMQHPMGAPHPMPRPAPHPAPAPHPGENHDHPG